METGRAKAETTGERGLARTQPRRRVEHSFRARLQLSTRHFPNAAVPGSPFWVLCFATRGIAEQSLLLLFAGTATGSFPTGFEDSQRDHQEQRRRQADVRDCAGTLVGSGRHDLADLGTQRCVPRPRVAFLRQGSPDCGWAHAGGLDTGSGGAICCVNGRQRGGIYRGQTQSRGYHNSGLESAAVADRVRLSHLGVCPDLLLRSGYQRAALVLDHAGFPGGRDFVVVGVRRVSGVSAFF